MSTEKIKHTPGPWLIARSSTRQENGWNITGENEWKVYPEDKRRAICSVNCPPIQVNARLISAAPDMLAALKLVKEHDRGQITGGDWDMINAAIAKAQGDE